MVNLKPKYLVSLTFVFFVDCHYFSSVHTRINSMACSRAVYGLIASLSAIIIGILQLALERSVLSHFQHRLAKHSTAWPPHQQHPSEIMPLAMVPEHLVTTPTNLIVACGALGLVTGVVGLFRRASIGDASAHNGVRPSNYTEKLQSNPRRPYWTLIMALLATLFALACFIYASLTESTRSVFRYTDYTSSHQSFTRESWTCQLATYYPDDEWSDLAGTCWEAVSPLESLILL
jgi:hypothetical protein